MTPRPTPPAPRLPPAKALALASLAAALAYAAGCVGFVLDGFVRRAEPLRLGAIGIEAPLGDGRSAMIPWTRLPIFAATFVALLGLAWAFHRGHPRARLAAWFTSFGLVLPQGCHVATHLAFLYGLSLAGTAVGVGLVVVLPVGLLALVIARRRPTAAEHDAAWDGLALGRRRLVATGVVVAWTPLVAEIYLARCAPALGAPGFVLAWLVLVGAFATVLGVLTLRTAALLGAVAVTAGAGALVLLLRAGPAAAVLAGPLGLALAWAPLAVVLGLTAPFWRRVGRALRQG